MTISNWTWECYVAVGAALSSLVLNFCLPFIRKKWGRRKAAWSVVFLLLSCVAVISVFDVLFKQRHISQEEMDIRCIRAGVASVRNHQQTVAPQSILRIRNSVYKMAKEKWLLRRGFWVDMDGLRFLFSDASNTNCATTSFIFIRNADIIKLFGQDEKDRPSEAEVRSRLIKHVFEERLFSEISADDKEFIGEDLCSYIADILNNVSIPPRRCWVDDFNSAAYFYFDKETMKGSPMLKLGMEGDQYVWRIPMRQLYSLLKYSRYGASYKVFEWIRGVGINVE